MQIFIHIQIAHRVSFALIFRPHADLSRLDKIPTEETLVLSKSIDLSVRTANGKQMQKHTAANTANG